MIVLSDPDYEELGFTNHNQEPVREVADLIKFLSE